MSMEESVAKLQGMEQELRNLEMQRQNMQMQLMESESSLKELKDYKGNAYKIIGPVMVESDPESLVKDLTEKIELLKVRVEAMDKQTSTMKQEFEELQKKLMESFNHANQK